MYLHAAGGDVAPTLEFSAPTMTRAAALSTYEYSTYSAGGELQRWSSIIGIVTAIIGNILISFALNIQRYAHIRLGEERAHRREKIKSASRNFSNGYGTTGTNGRYVNDLDGQDGGEDAALVASFHSRNTQLSGCSESDPMQDSTYLRSPYWWGGIVLMTVGEAGNFLAYGFAPASIVSPLGVVALISNCVIAPIMLKEHFRLRDFWGVVVAVAGAVTVVLSAKQQEKKLGPHEIWGAITRIEFEVYMSVTIILIGVLVWASPKYGNKTILIDLGLVGLFGGYTALATKGVASMLSYTLWRALTTPVTYVLVAVLVSTAVMQVKYMNKALQRFDSTQVIPVQFVMFTLSVIIGSAILYRDFEKATTDSALKFVGGCLLTFFGVFLITAGRPSRDEDDEEEPSDEGEERIRLADQDLLAQDDHVESTARKYEAIRGSSAFAQGGDAANDEDEIDESRRSSRVSFADSSPAPSTGGLYSNPSYQPSIRVTPSVALSESEDAPLLGNPWKNSSEELLQAARHPGLISTASSPILSSEAQSSTESLKPAPMTPRTNSQGNVHTHPNLQQLPAPPQADRSSDRPLTPARHSISRMMPGPFISPLSGGLSAVVADSLRRGFDSPLRSKSSKRSGLGLRRTKSGSQRLYHPTDGDEDVASSPTKYDDRPHDMSKSLEDEEWAPATRARSLSNTLGDLFRGRGWKTEPDAEGDDEAGPSGS